MRLSTKSTYGLRACFELALHYGEGPVSVMLISEKEGISMQYLEQLLNKLKKNGIVESIRGPKGGYILTKHPKDTRIGDIVRILENGLMSVSCEVDEKECDKMDKCVTKVVWKRLEEKIAETLDSTTLEDLLKEARSMGLIEKEKKIAHRFTFNI